MIINVTSRVAAERTEVARRSFMNYVGKTYPHFQGELDELKNALIFEGCKIEERITPIQKRLEFDVYFAELYSGLICQYNGVWTLVITNESLTI